MPGLRRTAILLNLAILAALALLHPFVAAGAHGEAASAPVEKKAVFAALATLELALALLFTRLTFRWAAALIDRWHVRIHQVLKIQRLEFVSAEQVKQAMLLLVRALRLSVVLVLWGILISLILSLFPEAEPLAEEIRILVLTPLETIGQAFIDYLPNLGQIVMILLTTRYVLKLVHLFFHAIEVGIIVIRDFYPEWAEPTYKIVRIIVSVFIALGIVPLLPGANSQVFDKIAFFIGLLVSLGSTSAIKNMTAGIVLTYMRSFQIGDRVRIGEATGDVMDKSLFVTRLKTIKNEQIAIPNGSVLDSSIVNFSAMAAEQGLILHTSVTIGYDVDWRQVHSLLIEAALRTPNVIEALRPFVLQTSLDDYYVAYEINAYTREPQQMAATLSALHQNILDSFHTAGVEIMSPAYSALRNGSAIAIPPEPAAADDVSAFVIESQPKRAPNGAAPMPAERPYLVGAKQTGQPRGQNGGNGARR